MFNQFAIMLLSIFGAPRPSEQTVEHAQERPALVARRA
jgi:hypothetical protein